MRIILIVSDTFRRDHLWCHGNAWISTPNLDRLAQSSFIFDHAYTGSFPTVPHRAELMTGRFVFSYYDWAPLPVNEVVLAEVLGEAGYITMMIADTPHILQDGYHFDRGFSGWQWIRGQENDRYMTDPIEVELPCAAHKLRRPDETVRQYLRNVSQRVEESDYFVAQTMSAAARWLERNYKCENFFLYVDTFDPHEPWDPPRWYVDLYDKGYDGEEVIYPAYGPCNYLTAAELKHIRALYAGEVTLVDRWIGHLLRKAEDLGILEDAVIIFTSDHGFYFGEHGLIGKGIIDENGFEAVPLYMEMVRIPLLIHLPHAQKFRRIDAIVQPADLMPTILELAGAEDPGTMHGRSLLPLLRGEKQALREYAVSSWPIIHGPGARRSTITTREWTLIYGGRWVDSGETAETALVDSIRRRERLKGGSDVRPELYHLPSDPEQCENVFDKHREVAEQLHREYVQFLESIGTPEEHLQYRREL